jgi:hypothetical protein
MMPQRGPLELLGIVEQSIGSAQLPRIGDTLNHRELWLRETSNLLGEAGVLEVGMVITTLARVQLSMGGLCPIAKMVATGPTSSA